MTKGAYNETEPDLLPELWQKAGEVGWMN